MAELSAGDRQRLIDLLADLPEMQNERSRLALLELAGLESLIPKLNLRGNSRTASSETVFFLEKYGRFTLKSEALGLLLTGIQELVDEEQQQVIDELLTKYAMMAPMTFFEYRLQLHEKRIYIIKNYVNSLEKMFGFIPQNLTKIIAFTMLIILRPLIAFPFKFSVVIYLSVIILRSLGFMQPFELSLLDWFMRESAEGEQDSRILLVEISEGDREYQEKQGWTLKNSLSDEAFEVALRKLVDAKASTIGVPIYRDGTIPQGRKALISLLEKTDNLFAICKVGSNLDGDSSISPPPKVPSSRITFSNFIHERGGNSLVRRQLLAMDSLPNSKCQAGNSLALILSLHYLDTQKNIKFNFTESGEIRIGDVLFTKMKRPFGGYQIFDDAGYQIIFNYRVYKGKSSHIVPRVKLQELLEGKVQSNDIEGKIVIFGVSFETTDLWINSYDKVLIQGIFLHSQMVNQILGTVLDDRPLIWAFPPLIDNFWILLWTIIGTILGRRKFNWKYLDVFYLSIYSICCTSLLSLAFALFYITGGWFPLLPSFISLMLACFGTSYEFKTKSGSEILSFKGEKLDETVF